MALCLLALALAAAPAAAEELHYRWSLGGWLGTLARVVLPGHGEGRLTNEPAAAHHLAIELVITSRESANGDFWRYAAVIDPDSGRTLSAESSYRFGEKSKRRAADLAAEQVIDVASGIHLVRTRRPTEPMELRIWSDGKIYPVVIEPRGWTRVNVGGERQRAEWFAIRPRHAPGGRRWSGHIDLYLEEGAAARPLAIVVDRGWARVRLELAAATQ